MLPHSRQRDAEERLPIMKAKAIALNLRGITQAYEVDPFPAEHRIMEPLFLSQPAFLLIPLPGVSSVFLAPVKTPIQ